MHETQIIDLRIDSMSIQTPEMLEAMRNAIVGDDIVEEDTPTIELQRITAQMMEKEAALFVCSGTMGNLLALLSHCPQGGEVLLGKMSHIFNYEVGGISMLARLSCNPVDDSKGIPDPDDVSEAIRADEIYFPKTSLLCLENSHNLAGGIGVPPNEIKKVAEVARQNHIPIHLDGARIFNAAAALGVELTEYSQEVDTIMFSLSKGLGAPVGAMLVGTEEIINRARKYRKMLGGGMRQTGYLTAPAIAGLKNVMNQSKLDNMKAKFFSERMLKIDKFRIATERMTNIVYLWLKDSSQNALDYLTLLEKEGIKVFANQKGIRLIFHNGITDADVDHTAKIFEKIFS